ncbi:cAMP-binding domain of CRP or a regulatory subunit of cAMP-dependent protein kinases [Pedobacter terrae]|uniref:cAMP-binding domain of CRP or a regulatory subunit of cAMP-dependent protein kinases n=1 Tax=Pedobacter terrae TaxID=405671 RepID=A0A1G7MYN1_9SPHI|nr:Crp/Fnr family transcriptional regulator [Pedobacter terrae]SDF66822.1 cAMP-binding domain of CRP or a regulatory subunit of cAMP-dependent protein kinases [Pedobacter terrae]
MKEFINFLLQFGNLSQPQIDLIKSKSIGLELKKGDCFWETGKASKHVGFMTSGILRVYYNNDLGDEITHYFVEENHWLSDWDNPDQPLMPVANLQAITECSFVAFSKKDWNALLQAVVGLNDIIQRIIIKHKSTKLERRSPLITENTTARYLSFLEQYPNMVNRIPLSYVASYLGMKQQSLSRVRKSIR